MASLFGVDPDRPALKAFLSKYYLQKDAEALKWPVENLEAQSLNYNTHATCLEVASEVKGPFKKAFRQLAEIPATPEMQEPVWNRAISTWSRYVLHGAVDRSWGESWSAHMILHLYKQLATEEYRTETHLRVVYAVTAAIDLCTTGAVVMDEPLDESHSASVLPAWHVQHPKSSNADATFMMTTGNRILHDVVPDSHPCKKELLQLYAEFQQCCVNYECVLAARHQLSTEESIRRAMQLDMATVTSLTGSTFNVQRTAYYTTWLIRVAQLLTCYQQILSTRERRIFFFDLSASMLDVLGIVDDLRDGKCMNVEIPKDLPIDECSQYVTDDMFKEFIAGEPHNPFLWASLELGRGESTAMDLSSQQKAEILITVEECYCVSPEIAEDSAARRARLTRLCAMFLKYNIVQYVKQKTLREAIRKYLLIQQMGVKTGLSLPQDLLSYSLGSLVYQETHSRSDEIASKIQRIMDTSLVVMSEKEKIFGLFDALQGI